MVHIAACWPIQRHSRGNPFTATPLRRTELCISLTVWGRLSIAIHKMLVILRYFALQHADCQYRLWCSGATRSECFVFYCHYMVQYSSSTGQSFPLFHWKQYLLNVSRLSLQRVWSCNKETTSLCVYFIMLHWFKRHFYPKRHTGEEHRKAQSAHRTEWVCNREWVCLWHFQTVS